MSAPKQLRWSKFWWADYERDPALRVCSLAAQGLWMRMLCFMHEGEPYGHLTLNGKPPTTKRLAAMVGKPEKEVAVALAELEEEGVFSRTEAGVIWSRRMDADHKASVKGREHGKGGGNPALKGKGKGDNPDDGGEPITRKVNGVDYGEGLTPPHKLEDRGEKKNKSQQPPSFVQTSREADSVQHLMPAADDPPERWAHLAEKMSPDEHGVTRPVVNGYFLDIVAQEVCRVARLPADWRGDWGWLVGWLKAGIESPQVLAGVKAVASRAGYRPPGTLKYFDGAVREARAA